MEFKSQRSAIKRGWVHLSHYDYDIQTGNITWMAATQTAFLSLSEGQYTKYRYGS